MNRLQVLNLWLNRLMLGIGAVALLIVMGVSSANVIMRAVARKPILGTYELSAFAGAIAIAGALGSTQHRKAHVVVDIVSGRYPAGLRRIVDVVQYLMSLTLFSFVAWHVVVQGDIIRNTGELSETLKIIYYPFVYFVAFGFVVMVVNLALDLLLALVPPTHPGAEA